jgi:hypothetical protein
MKNKIFFCVKTTQKYKDRIDTILDTWLNGIDDFIFYSDHEDSEKNVVLSSNDSSYFGCLQKTIWTFNNLKNIYYSDKSVLKCYDWVCVVDDDTFVNTKKLDEYIEEITDDSVYGDLITPENSPDNPIWKDLVLEHDYVYHSGGGGVLIPSKLLLDIEFEECGTVWDDVTVGVIFGRNNIPLVDSEVFKSQPPEFYGNTDDDVKNVVTYHHIKPDRMRLFYEKLENYL